MNEQNYPRFERLHVLRTAALVSIRDRAFDTLTILLDGYSDGIFCGCRPLATNDLLTLSTGLILHNGFPYIIREPMSVEYAPTEEYMTLKMIFEPTLETENFTQRNVALILSSDVSIADNELELCRFKLKKGAVLRTDYTDFLDRSTEFDTVNMINVPHAAIGGSTLSPEITTAFATEARDYELDGLDFDFCMTALRGETMSASQIALYIEHRLKTELPAVDNQNLYDGLSAVLTEIKSGGRREVAGSRRRRREIIVD